MHRVTTLRVVWIEIWKNNTDSGDSEVTTLRVVWIEILISSIPHLKK